VIWAAISLLTGHHLGIIAIAVGFIVGMSVAIFGGGDSWDYGQVGGFFAFFACLVGNFLAGIGLVAPPHMNYFEALFSFDYSQTILLMQAVSSPMDLIFYGIAVIEGFKFGMYST